MQQRNRSLLNQHGFAYVWILLVFTLLSLIIGHWASNYATVQQRYKEKELLRIGEEYRNALIRFYAASPGGVKTYPIKLEELLLDPRYLKVTRYMRQLPKDPISGNDFELIRNNNREIIAVRSTSIKKPIKQRGFEQDQQHFNDAQSYREWIFSAF